MNITIEGKWGRILRLSENKIKIEVISKKDKLMVYNSKGSTYELVFDLSLLLGVELESWSLLDRMTKVGYGPFLRLNIGLSGDKFFKFNKSPRDLTCFYYNQSNKEDIKKLYDFLINYIEKRNSNIMNESTSNPDDDISIKLEKILSLKNKGIISDEEYEQKRSELINFLKF